MKNKLNLSCFSSEKLLYLKLFAHSNVHRAAQNFGEKTICLKICIVAKINQASMRTNF